MVKKVFIDGMSCGHCAARIEKSLGTLDGVTGVKVNLTGKFAEIETTKDLDETKVLGAIDAAGYSLVKIG
ncbi:MAG: heavy-metal-associated domain-containing protein [Spirochaetales bacterium]